MNRYVCARCGAEAVRTSQFQWSLDCQCSKGMLVTRNKVLTEQQSALASLPQARKVGWTIPGQPGTWRFVRISTASYVPSSPTSMVARLGKHRAALFERISP